MITEKITIKKFFILVLISLIYGILDYYVCELVAFRLGIPLFCDTIFCMAMSFYANPLWGILVVIFYHLYDMLLSHSFVIEQLYMISAFIATITVWAFKKYAMEDRDNVFKTIGKLLLLSLIMCLAMSVSGGCISRIVAFLHEDGNEYTYQTEFLELIFAGKLSSPLIDSILVRIPVNLIDRLITVFSSWGIYKGMMKITNSLPLHKDN